MLIPNGLMLQLAASVCAVACGPVPKTRGEFVDAVRGGAAYSVHETFSVPRTLESLEATLRERSGACLDATVNRPPADRMSGPSSTRYLPEVARTDRLEFTLRVQHRPRGTREPETGLYVLAADLAGAGANTQVDVYAPTMGFDHIADALRGWIRGTSTECPELE
jgi:hypothetical protein